jgi:hypothetical protein
MYMYDETTGKKGSNECVSLVKYCVDKYISEEVKILKIYHHFPECGHSFMPYDGTFAQTGKIKEEYVSYRKNGTTVSSVFKKSSVVKVDQDVIPNLKLHLQLFFKNIIENKTTSVSKSQYQGMVCEGREVSVSTVQATWFAASSAS